jgi:hypothetical protein
MSDLPVYDVTAEPSALPGLAHVCVDGAELTLEVALSLPVVDLDDTRMPDRKFRAVCEVRTGEPYAGPDGTPVLPRCELIAVQDTGPGADDRLVRLVSSRPVVLGDHSDGMHPPLLSSTSLPVALLPAR